MSRFLRAMVEVEASEEGGPIRFVASTGGTKRDGLDLDQDRWMLGNYRANPVVLWVHDYFGERLPIGRAEVAIGEGRLIADVTFDQADAFAREVEGKYRRGFLNAVSVGWDEVAANEAGEWVPARSLGRAVSEDEIRYDLLDVSAVPVPGDPGALMERERAGLRGLRVMLDEALGEGDELGQVGEGRDPPAPTGGGPADSDAGVVEEEDDPELEQLERLYEILCMRGAIT